MPPESIHLAPGPKNDSFYENLNANGRPDYPVVVLDFGLMSWTAANEPFAASDPNGNGRIDFADIVALFTGV